jgi:hypothetical protein
MPSLKALAPLRRKRVALALHLLIACAVMLSFASQPDMMVRTFGVGACNVYLFFVALLTLRRVRREAAVPVRVSA